MKIIKTIILAFLALAILLNLNWLKIQPLGLILTLLYILIFGFLVGRILFKNKELSWQIIFGIFSLISAYSLLGALVYYFYQLNNVSISLVFALISGIIVCFNFRNKLPCQIKLKLPKIKVNGLILNLTYLILFAFSLFILWQSQTVEAIYSPWQVIPKSFIIIYLLATLNLILLLFYSKKACNLILLTLHFFLTTCVALIIYRLGYGYDPFVHQATENAILTNGFILPKPFYYLGQYSLVVTFAKLLFLPVELIDKLLLPIFILIFLPVTIAKSLEKAFSWRKNNSLLLTLIFLLLPFNLFIVTTPQALASIYCLIILFLSFLYLKDKQIPFYYLLALTLVALAIHALAGITILIYLVICWLIINKNLAAKIILPIFCVLSGLALPIALAVNSFISANKIKLVAPALDFVARPDIHSKQYNYFLDLIYAYKNYVYLLFIIIALITLIYLIKQKNAKIFISSAITFLILLINAILLSSLKVSSIINYEQDEFAKRIFQLAFYFLLPLVIYGFYQIIIKLPAQNILLKAFIILIMSGFLTCSLYLSYPRYDDYDNSSFINLSQYDLAAVKFIEKNSQDQPYLVLANQMTSAAALKTYGFTRYNNGQYFYPIPTGGQLYQYFDKMLYQDTSKQTMDQAMDLLGVKTAYFTLSNYWTQFKVISEKASQDAKAIYSINDKIYIYKFTK